MIDLNDVWQPPVRFDLAAVREQLMATAPDWLPGLFPRARLSPDRKTLRCADLSGRPPRKEDPASSICAGLAPAGATITRPANPPARST